MTMWECGEAIAETGQYGTVDEIRNGTLMELEEYLATLEARKRLVLLMGLRAAIRMTREEFDAAVRAEDGKR